MIPVQLADLVRLASAAPREQRIGVVYPCNRVTLEAVDAIQKAGFARPVLFGPLDAIQHAAEAAQIAYDDFEIVNTEATPAAAAQAAIDAVHGQHIQTVMKGALHTDELMAAIVKRSNNMRTERRISHAFLFELPVYHKLLALTDCVVNIAPDSKTKIDIISNAVDLVRSLGIARPYVSLVSAVETVNPAIQATVDARELVALGKTGKWGDALVDGPFGFDNAFSKEAARIKKIDSAVAGEADIMLLPDLNAGNILYKSFTYVAQSECAGVVLGAQVPIILTSRADSTASRLYSVALGVLASYAK